MSFTGSGIGPDGKIYCKHMEEAAKRKSKTPKHPNRDFYCCKRPIAGQDKCDFFVWADELVPRDSTTVASVPCPSAVSTIPRASREEADTSRRTTSASPTRPMQKSTSQSNGLSPGTPRGRKRIQDIEAGLRQREQDLSPVSPSKDPRPIKSLSSAEALPQPPSPVPTEVDGEVEAPLGRKVSFLGLDYTPELVASTLKDEDQPSTPKKSRLTPPAAEGGVQPAADAVPPIGGVPLTPPQSKHRTARFDEPQPTSPIGHSRKGKGREGVPPVQVPEQNGRVHHRSDLSLRARNSGAARESDLLPLFTLPEDTASTSSASPTVAENVLDYTDGLKARVKALSEYMDSFDVAQAAKILQTVERQKMQYECRDQSQTVRIGELVAEKDTLEAEVVRLKAALERSEASNRAKDVEIARLKGR